MDFLAYESRVFLFVLINRYTKRSATTGRNDELVIFSNYLLYECGAKVAPRLPTTQVSSSPIKTKTENCIFQASSRLSLENSNSNNYNYWIRDPSLVPSLSKRSTRTE